MKRWQVIEYAENSGEENMKIDAELFMKCEAGYGQPTLRFYGWKPWCVSIGRNQSFSIVNMNQCKKNGIDVVRRITGGGALLHAEEIAYSIVGYCEQPLFTKDLTKSYKLIHGWLISCFRKFGIQSELGDKNSGRVDICFSDISSYEIHVDGKKIVGSAQKRGKRAVLHHGSVLLKSNPFLTSRLLIPPEAISREQFYENLKKRSTGLNELNGIEISRDLLIGTLISAFNEHFGPVI